VVQGAAEIGVKQAVEEMLAGFAAYRKTACHVSA
jgi:hypothetical protein